MVATENIPDLTRASAADIAIQYPGAIPVMNLYRIDYCCGGKKSFAEACEAIGANPEVIFHEIREHQEEANRESKPLRFETWSPSLLADFTVENHHAYVREAIPQIKELLDKVCEAHAENHPALLIIRDDFDKLANDLELHMKKEELILFPAIRRLSEAHAVTDDVIDVLNPIKAMEDDHELAGNLIKSIRVLSNKYAAPPDACPTFLYAFRKLEEFDDDLMHHIHLENNILFEKMR